jgi:penicillin-insensitive murein endopeptidase
MKITLFFLVLIFSNVIWGVPVPVGTNNRGSLVDAMLLPESGEGYIHMYHEDEKYYGTLQMITMLQKASADIARNYPGLDRLQVEDISAQSGGDIDGHASHENGLDADVGYYKTDSLEHDPILRNQKYADPMVIKGKVSSNFDHQRNWELMKALHLHGDVQKIFVDVILKNELCRYTKKIGDYSKNIAVLRSLRHQENHQDHLHVRIRCPKDAKKCVNQPEAPEGSGCP